MRSFEQRRSCWSALVPLASFLALFPGCRASPEAEAKSAQAAPPSTTSVVSAPPSTTSVVAAPPPRASVVAAPPSASVAAPSAPPASDHAACSPTIVATARSIDLRTPEADAFFRGRFNSSDEKCSIELVLVLSERIDASANRLLRDNYCIAVATFARFLSPETIAASKTAYLRMGYDAEIAKSYFAGLRATRIDLRDSLQKSVGKDNWDSFRGPNQSSTEDASTWHYYKYLASLETPGALDKIERKLRATTSGNDVYNLLTSLAELKASPAKEAVKRILVSFAKDDRRVDGSHGPGPKLSELLALHLRSYD